MLPNNSLLIVGHGCYKPLESFATPVPIHFSTPKDYGREGDYTQIYPDAALYPYLVKGRCHEMLIDFVDALQGDLFDPLGLYIFMNGNIMRDNTYDRQLNIKLSEIITYVKDLQPTLENVYVWACRKQCSSSGGKHYKSRKLHKRRKSRKHRKSRKNRK